MSAPPLRGLRVLALEQYGAGPFGTQFLADLGADVVKIETLGGGDYARALGPWFVPGADDSAAGLFFQSCNRNKRSLALDIVGDEGRRVFHRLVGKADAVANNLRGDVPEKLGLTYEALKVHNPDIVCAHCSGYGRFGARRAWPGYDYLMQAESGYFDLADPDAPPSRFGLSIVDYMAGLEMALGLLAAVIRARGGGGGGDIDVSLRDAAFFNLNYLAAWALNGGEIARRAPRSAHPSLAPCQLYRAADGWIYLMCNKEKFWPILCALIGRENLIADPRFRTFAQRRENRAALQEILDGALGARRADEWLDIFGGRIPAAKVRTLAEALDAARAENRLAEMRHQSGAAFYLPACPIQFAGASPGRAAPRLGEHSAEILREAGLTKDEINALRKRGIIAP